MIVPGMQGQPGMQTVMMAPQSMQQGMQQVTMMPQGMQIPQGMQAMMMAPPMGMQPGQPGQQQPQMMMVMMPMNADSAGSNAMPMQPMMMASPQVMPFPYMASSAPAASGVQPSPAPAPTLPIAAPHGAKPARAGGLERVPIPPQNGKPWLRQSVTEKDQFPCVHWNVDARRFGGNNTKAVSPEFSIDVAGQGPQPFKLMIVPVMNPTKPTAQNRHSKQPLAWGKLELKCLAELQGNSVLEFSLGIGSGTHTQALRGPIAHDFAVQTSGGLKSGGGADEWDFGAAMDSSSKTVLVRLEISKGAV